MIFAGDSRAFIDFLVQAAELRLNVFANNLHCFALFCKSIDLVPCILQCLQIVNEYFADTLNRRVNARLYPVLYFLNLIFKYLIFYNYNYNKS